MITNEQLQTRQSEIQGALERFNARRRRAWIEIGATALAGAGFVTVTVAEVVENPIWQEVVTYGSLASVLTFGGLLSRRILGGDMLKSRLKEVERNAELRSILPDIQPPVSLSHSMKQLLLHREAWEEGIPTEADDPSSASVLKKRSGIAFWVGEDYRTGAEMGNNSELHAVVQMTRALYARYRLSEDNQDPKEADRLAHRTEGYGELLDRYLPIKPEEENSEPTRWIDFVANLTEDEQAVSILTRHTEKADL